MSGPDRWPGDLASGPEHYHEATILLEQGTCEYGCPHTGCPHEMRLLAIAQVHAVLALAAAVALSRHGDMPAHDSDAWLAAARVLPDTAEVTP